MSFYQGEPVGDLAATGSGPPFHLSEPVQPSPETFSPHQASAGSDGAGARPSPELPYPEAPLASRKAELPEREQGPMSTTAGLAEQGGRSAVVASSRSESSDAEPFSTRAENQAEALAVERHQERKHAARLSEGGYRGSGRDPSRNRDAAALKNEASPVSSTTHTPAPSESLADPKPPPRYIDPEVFAIFHSIGRECLSCGYWRASAHHLVSRAQGGDDVMQNLLGLCGACHGALHDGNSYHAYGTTHTPEGVRNRIGAFLTSEAGSDHLNYVKHKLGTGAAAFLSKYGVED